MTFPIVIKVVAPNNARAWIGLGCWILVLVILAMILYDRTLLQNSAFLVISTAIVTAGWVQGPVGWAYQATQAGGEAAESSARIAEEAATAAIKVAAALPASSGAPDGTEEDPLHIAGTTDEDKPPVVIEPAKGKK